MQTRNSSFRLKNPAIVENIIRHWKNEIDRVDKDLKGKITLAVSMIYNTARTRRPKVSGVGVKKGTYRVSDSSASYGVPVDTGALQASINKKVIKKGLGWQGVISAGEGLDYANYIEFGTSKIAPRPFMRQAMELNKDAIRNLFKKPIPKNA